MSLQPRARYREFLLNPAFFGVSEMTARSLPFQLTDCCSQSSVLDEISEVTEHRFRKSCQRFLLFSRRAGEAYHGAIGLELRKRQLKHLAGAFPPKFFDEVDGHVVAGAETGGEGGAAQRGDLIGLKARTPVDNRVSLNINPSAPCSSGELGVLPRGDRYPGFSVELFEFFNDHRPSRHVDSECESLCCEDDLKQASLKEFLHEFLERRKHSGVVCGNTALRRLEPLEKPEHGQIIIMKHPNPFLDPNTDLVTLVTGGQPNTRTE